MNIINLYGEQECRTDKATIEDNWNTILEELARIEKAEEAVILIGDMNKHVGNGEYGVKENITKVSNGGKLINDFKNIWLHAPPSCDGVV